MNSSTSHVSERSRNRMLVALLAPAAAALLLAGGCAPPEGDGTDEAGESAATAEQGASADEASHALRSALQDFMGRYRGNIVEAAELMPEEHYDFQPTEDKRTFAGELAHVATSSVSLCRALGGDEAPEAPDLSELHGAGKDDLVAGVEQAFDYCGEAISTFDDATRGEEVTLFGDFRSSRAMAALILAADWGDHYGHLATYMRLNDLLPPTARESSEG